MPRGPLREGQLTQRSIVNAHWSSRGGNASFFFERDEEKNIDPQLAEINERLARVEELLTNGDLSSEGR